jgi:hypothetical protein
MFEIRCSVYGVNITKEASIIVSETAIAPWIIEARKTFEQIISIEITLLFLKTIKILENTFAILILFLYKYHQTVERKDR